MNSGKEPFDGDDLLTETYRELGVEKAPEHLNQSILRMASGGGEASEPQNGLFAAWMKPVAWAATIGLSLAIVLEFSELPTAPVRSGSVPTAESTQQETPEEAPGKDAAASETIKSRARPESAPNQQRVSDDKLGRSTAAHDDVEIVSREALDAVAAPAAARQAPIATKTGISAAKEQAAEIPADSQPMASYALSLEHSDIDDGLCSAAARLSKERWQTCIDELRSRGSEEAADREYEAFILKYPDASAGLEGNR